MSEIVLATFNARYWHSAFGLRYLLANMGDLAAQTEMLEFGLSESTTDVLARILVEEPQIVGLGVYIWNVEQSEKLVADLKQLRPDITVVLGGPEVSYECEGQRIVDLADYVISGEADLAFPGLCRQILEGTPPLSKIVSAPLPQFGDLQLPYHLYSDEDIRNRVIYVEASRGCPFTCEFCLSALDIPVRQADVDEFLSAMQVLLDRGARQFKFVDRTFNLNLRAGQAILQFFLDRYEPGMFLHFEMIPDRLPESLRELISKFPVGSLQFEIGVQTFNESVGELISRRQDNDKLIDNFRFLREKTSVHIHADLIIGLPGESVESFGKGFDRLVALGPQEIQVGILKRLKGTPITRHDDGWEMVYSAGPPFEILSNRLIDFELMQRLRRFARYWDLIANSGNFVESRELIWHEENSPFECFLRLSDWLFDLEGRAHGIPLARLSERLFEFLTKVHGVDPSEASARLWRDYVRGGRRDRPAFLRHFDLPQPEKALDAAVPLRQHRHASAQG